GKGGASELSLSPNYFRQAVSDLTAEDVLVAHEKIYSDLLIDDAKKFLTKHLHRACWCLTGMKN
ncbi:MAG: hypothetical protein OEM28_04120, partial [Nitrosopumilus sp.]|nr:hypothetical protein [Nitrosopumilus sp.]